MTPRGTAARVSVRVNASVWREEVERFDPRSPARTVAERERRRFETDGVRQSDLMQCQPNGPDGTRLGGLVKVYAPISQARPYGFVFAQGHDSQGEHLEVVAFGERHPRPRARSVYQRAHTRLHGAYPDQ